MTKRIPHFFWILFLISFSLLFFQNSAFSQSSNGVIIGKVQDSTTKKNIPFATITVFNAIDTAIITYRISEPSGVFRIPGLPINTQLRVLISHTGYRVERFDIKLDESKPELNMGTLKLLYDSKNLDEVLVLAERPPVIVRNDTIEFNASSFKTLPNALVEDLLKKLPGVHVDRNGNITYNGVIVNRIQVDGKSFFGNDPKIASRNLPANIIDKVQVVDDAEQLEKNVFLDRARIGKVINLKLKKWVKKGSFGKLYAGIGTDDRYEGGGIYNVFRDTLQVSLIGFSNNINRAGFGIDDVRSIGGFARGGYSSSMMMENGSFELDGISFGATSEGVQKSTGAGININTEFGKKVSVNWRYFFSQLDANYEQLSNSLQYLNDSIIASKSNSVQDSRQINHSIGGTLKYQINKSSYFTVKPSVGFIDKRSSLNSFAVSEHNEKGLLNESKRGQNDKSDINSVRNDISYYKNFSKRGRSLSLSNSISFTRNVRNQITEADNVFYNNPPLETSLSQLRINSTPAFRLSLSGGFSEPLSSAVSLRIINNAYIARHENDIRTFDKNTTSSGFTIPNEGLTDGIRRWVYSNLSTVDVNWRIKKLTIYPGLSFRMLAFTNTLLKGQPQKKSYDYILPSFGLSMPNLYLSYSSDVMEPNILDMQPVVDNTNPLYIYSGNPYLLPTRNHSIYATFDKYNSPKLMSYRLLFNSIIEKDGAIIERTLDAAGVQRSKPVNTSGLWSFRVNGSVTKNFKKMNKWNISLTGGIYADYKKRKVLLNKNISNTYTWNFKPSFSANFNLNDKFELNQEFSMQYSRSIYDNSFFRNINILVYNTSSEVVIRPAKRFIIEGSLDYYYNPDIDLSIASNAVLLNAALTMLFLKNDQASLKLSSFDLLDQNRNITQTISENYKADIRRTTLQRFFMLSLIYNIRNFKPIKVGGREKLFFF
jgi:hypothetical protein